jgi:hypothetical protein
MADAGRARRIAGCAEASDRVLVDLVQKPRDRALLETRVVFMVRKKVRNTRPQARKILRCVRTRFRVRVFEEAFLLLRVCSWRSVEP